MAEEQELERLRIQEARAAAYDAMHGFGEDLDEFQEARAGHAKVAAA